MPASQRHPPPFVRYSQQRHLKWSRILLVPVSTRSLGPLTLKSCKCSRLPIGRQCRPRCVHSPHDTTMWICCPERSKTVLDKINLWHLIITRGRWAGCLSPRDLIDRHRLATMLFSFEIAENIVDRRLRLGHSCRQARQPRCPRFTFRLSTGTR